MDDFFSENLAVLPDFLIFFVVAAVITAVFALVYAAVTQHNELKLIRENSSAAAIAFSGSLLGFALPLASAMVNSNTVLEIVMWGLVALIVQIIVYYVVRIPMPGISRRIEENEVAAGIWLGTASVVGGILNAAAMTN